MVRMPWTFTHLTLGPSFKEQWKGHLWQALQWPSSHGIGDRDQRQGWCANTGWLPHNKKTVHCRRDWKTYRYGQHQRTWLQKSLCKLGAENAHHQTHISPKKHLCRISSAQWRRLRWFLSIIITSGGTWVHHYEPLTKRQSMEGHRRLLPCKKNSSCCKLLCITSGASVIWNSEGILLVEFFERGATINS